MHAGREWPSTPMHGQRNTTAAWSSSAVSCPSPREMKGIDLREPMSNPAGPTDGAAVVVEQRRSTSFTLSRLTMRSSTWRSISLIAYLVVSTRRRLGHRDFISSEGRGPGPHKGAPVFVLRPKGRKTGPSPRRNGHTATAPPPRPGRPHQRSQPPNQPKNSILPGFQTPRSLLGRMVAIISAPGLPDLVPDRSPEVPSPLLCPTKRHYRYELRAASYVLRGDGGAAMQ